jgi:hypothetical protein
MRERLISGKNICMTVRAHRCEVPDRLDGAERPDYASAFEVSIPEEDERSPERWARAVFEDTPTAMRWFVEFGWRFVLGLRLGPRSDSNLVSGWRVQATQSGVLILEAQSGLLTATKEIRIAHGTVCVSTFVRYNRRLGRVIWTLITPVHHHTEPYLLGYAASRREAPKGNRDH